LNSAAQWRSQGAAIAAAVILLITLWEYLF
jgi:hypothetical protein